MDCVKVKQEIGAVNTEVEDNTYIFDCNNDSDNTNGNDPFNNSSDESISNYNSDNDPFKEEDPDEDFQLKNEKPFDGNKTKADKISHHILNDPVVKKTPSTGATSKDYRHLPNNEYACKHCDYVSKIRKNVYAHLRQKHMNCESIKKCPHCPYETKDDLKLHIICKHKKDNEIDWHKCHQCDYKAKLKCSLMTHLLTHKTVEEKMCSMLKCDHCPKMFQLERNLRRHISVVHDGNKPDPVKCHLCGNTYSEKKGLIKHIKKNHGNYEKLEMLSCEKCNYKTKFEHSLKVHSKVHVKRFQCEKCPYQGHSLTVMKFHKINHQEVKNEKDLKYKCDKCDYKTYRQYSFQVHKLKHLKPEEIQYFYCYHCDFKTKRKDNLKQHIETHSRKKLVCYICDFEAKHKSTYVAHIEKHSEEQKAELRRLETYHNDKTKKENMKVLLKKGKPLVKGKTS